MSGAFAPGAFVSGAYLTTFKRRRVLLPAAWLDVVPGQYVCKLSAAVLLVRGSAWALDAGALVVGGARLVGQAGGVFEFASVVTAGRWVAENADDVAHDLDVLRGMSQGDAEAWRAVADAAMAEYAARLVVNASRLAAGAVRDALIAESELALGMWA